MMFTTNQSRFFDIDVPTEVAPAGQSIAALMATHGIKSEAGMSVEIPSINTGTPEPVNQAAPSEPAATANPEPDIRPDITTPEVSQAPPTEPTQVSTPQIAEAPKPVQTWQEVLKSQPETDVLKELGYDERAVSLVNELKGFEKIDFFTGLLKEWKEKGTLTGYLKELTTDYAKMPAEEVMRHQLKLEYPRASDKQLEILFNKNIVEKYGLNSVDESEMETGKELLEAEADRHRDQFVNNQQKYLTPKPPEPSQVATPDPMKEREQQRQKEAQAFASYIDNDPYTKSLESNKALVMGEGDEKFNFPVDPAQLKAVLTNQQEWANHLFTEKANSDGSKVFIPDAEKQFIIAGIAVYGKQFLNAYAQHFKTIGGKAAIAPIENASKPDGSSASATEVAPITVAEAMARQGRLV